MLAGCKTETTGKAITPSTTKGEFDTIKANNAAIGSLNANGVTIRNSPTEQSALIINGPRDSGTSGGVWSTGPGAFSIISPGTAFFGEYVQLMPTTDTADKTSNTKFVMNSYQHPAWVVIDTDVKKNSYFNVGNIGIGTETPKAKLDVAGDIQASTGISLFSSKGSVRISSDDQSQDGGGIVKFYIGPSNFRGLIRANIPGGENGLVYSTPYDHIFTGATPAKQKIMTLKQDQNVVINKLAGTGNAYVCANAQGQLYRSTTACR